jgi:hypothetical protein
MCGAIRDDLKVNGRIIRWTEKVSFYGPINENMKAPIKMIRKKGLAFLNGNFVFKVRNDGRIYKGNWKNGKQHGEGEFYNRKEGVWKKGLWGDGKRLRWENSSH